MNLSHYLQCYPNLVQVGKFEQQKPYGSDSWRAKGMCNFLVPTALAGLLGFGTLGVAFADDGHEVRMFLTLRLCYQ